MFGLWEETTHTDKRRRCKLYTEKLQPANTSEPAGWLKNLKFLKVKCKLKDKK